MQFFPSPGISGPTTIGGAEQLQLTGLSLDAVFIFLKQILPSLPSLQLSLVPTAGSIEDRNRLFAAWRKQFQFLTIKPIAPVQQIEYASSKAVLANSDLLSVILSQLEVHFLPALRLVCQRWNRLIPLVPADYLTQHLNDLEPVMRSFPRLRTIHCQGFLFGQSGKFDLRKVSTLQHLRTIDIPFLPAAAATHLVQLQSLGSLRLDSPFFDFSVWPQLTRLDCLIESATSDIGGGLFPTRTNAVTDSQLAFDLRCLSSLLRLESLSFSGSGTVTPSRYPNADVLISLRRLTHLDMGRATALLIANPEPLMAQLTNLRATTLVAGPPIRLPKLQYLSVMPRGNPFFSGVHPDALAASDLPELSSLFLMDTVPIGDLPRLSRLRVASIPPTLVESLSRVTALCELIIASHTPIVTYEFLRSVPRVTSLRLAVDRDEWPESLQIATQLRALSFTNYRLFPVPGEPISTADPTRCAWLRHLTSLHTLQLNHSALVLDACAPWVSALTGLTHLECNLCTLRPSHMPKLAQLRSLTHLRVNELAERFELRRQAHEYLPRVHISAKM